MKQVFDSDCKLLPEQLARLDDNVLYAIASDRGYVIPRDLSSRALREKFLQAQFLDRSLSICQPR